MLRISVTDLESFRYFKNLEDRTLDDLLADLAHVSPPTPKMAAGKALASFFETARIGDTEEVLVDGWQFFFDLDAAVPLPVVREMKVEETINTPCGPVTLVGKVDGLDGLTVRDQKLTDSLDAEGRYVDSLQWRSYLTMFGARRFIYDVLVGKLDEKQQTVTVREYHPLTFYSYPGMREDVERAVCELAEVVSANQEKIAALRAAHK
jgi:hypothetical protein